MQSGGSFFVQAYRYTHNLIRCGVVDHIFMNLSVPVIISPAVRFSP